MSSSNSSSPIRDYPVPIIWEEGDPCSDGSLSEGPLSPHSSLSITPPPSPFSPTSPSSPLFFPSHPIISPSDSQDPSPPSTPTTPHISGAFLSMALSSQGTSASDSDTPKVPRKPYLRRKKRAFRGNQNTTKSTPPTSTPESSQKSIPVSKPFIYSLPSHGYISQINPPRVSVPSVIRCESETGKSSNVQAHKPTGFRMMDMTILSDVFATLHCEHCHGRLSLFEKKWCHGWQTFFIIKCERCHRVYAKFPSSKPLDTPNHHTCVNVDIPATAMTEITMRTVVAVHTTSMSHRDIHKFATIFDMPPPIKQMQPRYLERFSYSRNESLRHVNARCCQLTTQVELTPSRRRYLTQSM